MIGNAPAFAAPLLGEDELGREDELGPHSQAKPVRISVGDDNLAGIGEQFAAVDLVFADDDLARRASGLVVLDC
jgi:hypothetical protein